MLEPSLLLHCLCQSRHFWTFYWYSFGLQDTGIQLLSPPSYPSYPFFPLPHFCQPFVVLFPVPFPYMTTFYRNPSLSLSFSIWMLKTSESVPVRPLTWVLSEYIYVVALGHPASTCPEWTQLLPLLQTCVQPMALSGYYLVCLSHILGDFTTCGFCLLTTCGLFLLFLMPYFQVLHISKHSHTCENSSN